MHRLPQFNQLHSMRFKMAAFLSGDLGMSQVQLLSPPLGAQLLSTEKTSESTCNNGDEKTILDLVTVTEASNLACGCSPNLLTGRLCSVSRGTTRRISSSGPPLSYVHIKCTNFEKTQTAQNSQTHKQSTNLSNVPNHTNMFGQFVWVLCNLCNL